MDFLTLTLLLSAAAAGGRVYATPPEDETWELISVDVTPNETNAVDGANYATLQGFRGDDAATAARSHEAEALTQGTAVSLALTATGSKREITRTNPFSLRSTQTGTGAAVDVSATVVFLKRRV